MKKSIRQLLHIGIINTLWFNMRYLPLNLAIRIPVILARDVSIRSCKRGSLELLGGAKFGMLRFGFGDRDHNYDRRSSLSIQGKIIIEGTGIHAFGPGTCLRIGEKGTLKIGNNFTCSVNNRIYCSHCITIGDDNMWSFDNIIMDTDSHRIFSEDSEDKEIANPNKEVIIGNHVWVGCRNIILKGTTIPDGCVVASGSKLTKAYSLANSIITSNKVIKQNIYWSRQSAF